MEIPGLLEALIARLEAAGVRDLVLGALPGNTAAIRLCQRHGFARPGPTCHAWPVVSGALAGNDLG